MTSVMTQISTLLQNKLQTINQQTEAIRLLYTYRYCSLILTSGFYLFIGPSQTMPYKLMTVFSLLVVAKIITSMYVKNLRSTHKLKIIIILETIIITLLLIPSGGLDSPFVWYALNPVFIAASYLSIYFCWFNLIFYLVTVEWLYNSFVNKGITIDSIFDHSYLVMIFVLITLLVQLLSTLMKRLQFSNIKQRESLDHIMSLYKVIEAFTNDDELEEFFRTFTHYIAKLTKADLVFFWHKNDNLDLGAQLYSNIEIIKDLKEALCIELKLKTDDVKGFTKALTIGVNERNFYAVIVKSSSRIYGVFGLEVKGRCVESETYKKQLNFLSDLSSIILERFTVEENNDRIIVLEERNRIANEIHDSVSQRLFSINFALHNLKGRLNQLSKKELSEQLELLSNSTNLANRELRSSIYSLTTQKSEERIFFSTIKLYLSNLEKLNDLNINVSLEGEEDLISANLKKSLYRVICEATGNSVKHGNCNDITVSLNINSEAVNLIIWDNGRGFDLVNLKYETLGLGLINIKNMINSYGGQIIIQSEHNKGTRIEVLIPNRKIVYKKHGGMAL